MKGWMIYVFIFLVGIYPSNVNLDNPNTDFILQRTEVTAKVRPILTSREGGGRIYKVAKGLTMTATAYTHTGHKTASDTWPKAGRAIAVNPKVIPLDSEFEAKKHGRKSLEIRR